MVRKLRINMEEWNPLNGILFYFTDEFFIILYNKQSFTFYKVFDIKHYQCINVIVQIYGAVQPWLWRVSKVWFIWYTEKIYFIFLTVIERLTLVVTNKDRGMKNHLDAIHIEHYFDIVEVFCLPFSSLFQRSVFLFWRQF